MTHDYLVLRIVRWLGDAFWNAQRAREIIRESEASWATAQRLLAPTDLQLVLAQQDKLTIGPAATAAIFASAVAYDEPAETWAGQLTLADRQNALLVLTEHPQGAVRLNGTRHLADPYLPTDG